jgi:hypothetical protein
MKNQLPLLLALALNLCAFQASANVKNLNLEGPAEVDALVAAHQVPLTQEEISLLPQALVCGKNTDQQLSLDESSFQSIKLRTNEAKSGLIMDWSDGDQVGGLFVKTKELQKLTKGLVNKIAAKSYNGFWYMDGDHYELTDTECELN